MSRIAELIAENCPDGVVLEALSDVASLKRGTSITKKQVTEGNIPVIAGGRSAAYLHGEFNRDGETIVVAGSGAYAGLVSWWDGPIFVSDAFSVEPEEERLLPKYCFHWLSAKQSEIHSLKSGGGVPHVYAKDVGRLRIPVPPLEVQRAIVEVLDTFSKLEAELEAELEARKQQYEHYRNQLLAERITAEIPRFPMGDVGKFTRGRRFTKRDFVESGVPSIHYGEIYTDYGVSAVRTVQEVRADIRHQLRFAQTNDVIFAGVGETVEDVGKAVAWLGDHPVAVHDDTFFFTSELNPKFVAYFSQTHEFNKQKESLVARGKVKRLSSAGLASILIPVPSTQEQERIVTILDKFDALVNDLSVGLPAELAARRQQYEHYRDKLLTFKELEVAA